MSKEREEINNKLDMYLDLIETDDWYLIIHPSLLLTLPFITTSVFELIHFFGEQAARITFFLNHFLQLIALASCECKVPVMSRTYQLTLAC
ncbi:MAG: hypothetical protein ACFFD4_18015 [Candidatus Odinarchaeota archaeon]